MQTRLPRLLKLSGIALAFSAAMVARTKPCAAQVVLETRAEGSWFPTMPVMKLDGVVGTSLRTMVGGELVSPGSGFLTGGYVGANVLLDRRWAIPVLSFGIAGAAGPSERVDAATDGSHVQLKPWTAWQFSLLGPGIERRVTLRRWMLAASVRGGVSMMWMGADIATGGFAESRTSAAISPVVRAEVRGCRRLDPSHRLCLWAAPHVYQYGWLNGLSTGVLWELGP